MAVLSVLICVMGYYSRFKKGSVLNLKKDFYTYMYIHTRNTHTHTHTHTNTQIYIYIFIYMNICLYMHICYIHAYLIYKVI